VEEIKQKERTAERQLAEARLEAEKKEVLHRQVIIKLMYT
jgi:chorismate-pyruvate lyase